MRTTTPPLPVPKADYLRGGILSVEGWLDPSTATYLSAIEVLQRQLGIAGDVCEIGVHHGKSFLCLALGLPPGDRAVAVDVFEDQHLNTDRSGRGDRAVFQRNLADHGASGNVDIVQASSLDLHESGFVARGRRFRLFSIDGGHTPDVTANDLRVAERTLVERGVAVLDDLLNPAFLGVITGLFQYWAGGGTLVPVAVVPGKLLLVTNADEAIAQRAFLVEHFGAAVRKRQVPLGNAYVDVFNQFPWVVVDERGNSGILAVPPLPDAIGAHPLTTAVPTAYLADLELRAVPLRRRLGRSLPKPVKRLYRRLKGLRGRS
jgi:hypothetical protein